MREIVIGAVAAAALAWAQGAQADHHTPEAQQKKADQAEKKAGRAEQKAERAEKKAEQKADQAGTGSGSQSGMSGSGSAGAPSAPGAQHPGTDSATATQDSRAGASGAQADTKHPLFEGKKNFDLEGKVSKASSSEITIERKDGLPPATLKLGTGTKVEMDGKQVSAAQLQPGQDVKASFNLRGETAEAVEVKAKKAEGGDRKEMQEQRRENQQERSKDAQQNQQRSR